MALIASAAVAELFSCYLGDTPQINTGGVQIQIH